MCLLRFSFNNTPSKSVLIQCLNLFGCKQKVLTHIFHCRERNASWFEVVRAYGFRGSCLRFQLQSRSSMHQHPVHSDFRHCKSISHNEQCRWRSRAQCILGGEPVFSQLLYMISVHVTPPLLLSVGWSVRSKKILELWGEDWWSLRRRQALLSRWTAGTKLERQGNCWRSRTWKRTQQVTLFEQASEMIAFEGLSKQFE